MTASKIFLYFCLSFIGGIFLNSFLKIPQLLMPGVLIFGFILITVLWEYKSLAVFGFCLLFLALGIWRHQAAEFKVFNNELRKYNASEETVTLTGVVAAEPDIREKSIKLTLDNLAIETKNVWGRPSNISGRVLVTTWRYPEYKYGDRLRISGKLEVPPEDIDGFNYKDYLKKDGIYSFMKWPEVELLERGNYHGLVPAIYAKIFEFKKKLSESIYQNLSPPQSSILGAMVLGDKRKLSEDLKIKLNIVGLRHITAISGLHITILTAILMTILIGLGFWRQQAFWLSIILITLFIIMTGLQPSAIRAGIMGGLFLLGQYLGRMNVSSRSIVFAASLMLAQNPLLLKLDAGFQLSFLATIGIIYLMPIFQNWFRPLTKIFGGGQLKSILAMTLSAQVFTLPILIYNFGYISLVAPITNILIVPLLYWIMLFGFIFAIFGAIWQPLAWILSFPCWFLLTYLTKIVDLFSQPWAVKIIENVHWLWLIISYLILAIFVYWLKKRERLKFLNY